MKILVIPTTDWVKHPVPNRLNFIFDELATRNEVHVLGFDYERFKSVPQRTTKCNIIPAGKCTGSLTQFFLRNAGNHYSLIKDTVKEKDIDVILSANIMPSFMANYAGVPIVYDYLDVMHEAASAYISNPLMKKVTEMTVYDMVKQNLNNAKGIITITNGLKEYIVSNIIHDFKRWEEITVIPNGVDTSLFKPSEYTKTACKLKWIDNDKPVIGYIGSVEPWIDLITPIKGMKNIDGTLVIVGPSYHTEYGNRVKAFAANCGYSEKIKFFDAIPYNTLPKMIQAFDIGINPLVDSIHNKFSAGGKIFNYLACGIPMLTTPAVSPPYYPTYDAYHFYQNTEDFIERVNEMLQITPQPMKLHNVAKQYDWKVLAKEYETVLDGVLE